LAVSEYERPIPWVLGRARVFISRPEFDGTQTARSIGSIHALETAQSAEALMTENRFLTAEGVSEHYRREITVGTLRNWRAMRVGRGFMKFGKVVFYPISELDAWDEKNTVTCRASRSFVFWRRDEA
jgi:hypothetical protein